MSDDIEKLASSILVEIKKANKILLHLHPSPDADSVGSSLAMMECCEVLGKEVVVIGGDSPLPKSLAHLPGFGKIVEKNFKDIDLTEFDLFLVQDSGSKSRISREVDLVFPANLKTIIIDHHLTNEKFADINLVVSYPSTTQILFELFNKWQVEITKTMAVNLFVGTYTDTGGFKYSYTLPSTFQMASKLIEVNKEAMEAVIILQNQLSSKALVYKKLAFENIIVCAGGKVALTGVSYEEFQQAGVAESDTEGVSIAAEMLSVKGWVATGTIMEKDKGQVRISLRSKDAEKIDVSEIASLLGGGGHRQASGTKLNLSFAEGLKKVKEAFEQVVK